ncbi:MAG: amidohydrolase family protein [Calditrichaeota bacterium]|nr:MAG: amidohydrolase family protein [Calditrichota bacterium]
MRILVFISTFLISVSGMFAQEIYLHCGRLIDSKSNNLLNEKTIVIKDDKIFAVHDGYVKPDENSLLIDLKNNTVMPGLMDLHTHLVFQFHEKVYMEKFYLDEADKALRATVYAKKTLLAGFTTVRELGGSISNSLRDAIAKGWVDGPRIFSAGNAIATTGGHADPTSGLNAHFIGNPGPKDGVINGPDEARKAVRQRYKNGADWIKITATGGVLSTAKNGQNPQFTMDELAAIIETADDYGMHVAAHAHGAEGIKRAIKAGVRSIEHGSLMDDEGIQLMKKNGTWFVPTLSAGKWVAEKAKKDGYFPPMVAHKAAEIGPKVMATFAKAYKSGVKIAFGSDCAVSPHGDNANEFIYMVEGGMQPLEAIRSATLSAAQLLEIDDRLGTIENGKIADIIAVPGNPLKDIAKMKDVVFVMKEGKVYKQP